ncbi:nucleotidyltransferase family protein [Prolixibacteraceae bacterium JC049]|nr:nucleotidyltransferase family protein [Prolixibacteraceae bacterium JC049]
MNAMIFAAGLGTRLQPYTNNKPKAMVELAGRPLLAHCIENLLKYSFKRIVVNVHHFADQIIEFLNQQDYPNVEIIISDERNELLETGGGLAKAAPLFIPNQPVLICNVDILSDLDLTKLIAYHETNNALATLAVRDRSTSRYLLFDNTNRLSGWTNISTGEIKEARPLTGEEQKLAFSGIHVVSPELFPLITEKGKFPIIQLYLRLAQQHLIKGFDHSDGYWMDVGKPEQLKQAEIDFFQKNS